ncbi:MAG TPA: polysaccharide biosynthesis/export family protein [Planctomycetaceae bacterium]|nr:polysaccharide biosynthesis/export family protein [Planctomycetaceae bacterium]
MTMLDRRQSRTARGDEPRGGCARRACRGACLLVAFVCLANVGCVNSLKNTVPAHCLPPDIVGPSRDDLQPINFTSLGQKAPPAHLIGPNDILGIYIQGVLGSSESLTPDTHFPPTYGTSISGNFTTPAVGMPVTVLSDGTIELPHVPPVPVAGMTLVQATEKIREVYTSEKLLQAGRDVINVTLMKARTIQVLVMREDSIMNWPILKSQGSTLVVKRGSANSIDLPVYQNDVLHALTQSGGLPGSDAPNELWVLHGTNQNQWDALTSVLDRPGDLSALTAQNPSGPTRVTRIKLKVYPGEPLDFLPEDVVLDTGDVVFLPSRDAEHFFTGGMLFGQQITLPRDYELDVISAISMAGGSPAGPPGWNSASSLFAGNGGPGALIPPTRVLILRKLPEGGHITIHVDLKRALHDRSERIPIRAGDVILLQFTPGEVAANYLLNLFNFNASISRNFFSNVH